MDLDLDTVLLALYVIVDDLSQRPIRPHLPACGGPPAQMRDSEGRCLGLAAQWRSGVPWNSERRLMRYVHKHRCHRFPVGRSQSALHRRLRRLWGAFLLRQDAVATALATAPAHEVLAGFPIPMAHGARSFHPGGLYDIARIGTGGTDRSFYGVRMLLVMRRSGGATGWGLAAGNGQERWLAEFLCSARAGRPPLRGPLHPETQPPTVTPPTEWMAPGHSCGHASHTPVMTDSGFRGADGRAQWATAYGVPGCPPTRQASRRQRRWWSAVRHVGETTCAPLRESFGRKYPGAHTGWGLLTRVAAKVAAYHLGIMLHRVLGRPDFAFATLIV